MAIVASLSHGVAAQGESDIGAGFYRIMRTGSKPDPTPVPTNDEFAAVASRRPIAGDIAVVTYSTPNAQNEFSCAFEYGTQWILAAEFIDGNLVVAGSVFSRVGFGAGIAVSELMTILEWDDATDTIPALVEGQAFRGSYLGFVNNPNSPTATAENPTQEILLVGDQDDHLFWDGESLTLSGVTIEDPTILVTPTAPPLNDGADVQVGDVVSADITDMTTMETETRLFRAIMMQEFTGPNSITPPPDATLWEDITEDIPRGPVVTVSVDSPASATQGDLWYDESIGRLFLFVAQAGQMDPVDLTLGAWADVTKN